MKLTKAGLQFIAKQEGCVLRPYNDSANNATIGIGHLIHYGPVTAADDARYAHFTMADALKLLAGDVATAEATVKRLIHRPVSPDEYTAMVDLVFNCGPGPLEQTAAQINRDDWTAATAAWQAWIHAGGTVLAGLVRRRAEERALALTPDAALDWQRELSTLAARIPKQLQTRTIHRRLAHARAAISKRVQQLDS